MKAVIMAGGEGTRLRPLTCNRPKPMVPILNRPMMEHIIQLLKRHGFSAIASTLWYLPEHVTDYFQDGSRFGVQMEYYVEREPLGTAGSVKNASEFLDDTFIVVSGDALTDIDLSEAIAFHKARGSVATLVLKSVPNPLSYGVVLTTGEGRITQFLEKPSWDQVFSDTVNTGIYILEPEVLDLVRPKTKVDFSQNVFPELLRKGAPLFGYIASGYWSDIGNLEAYRQAQKDCLDGRVVVDLPQPQAEGVYLERGVEIHPEARLQGPLYLGEGVRIEANAYLGPYSVVGSHSQIGPAASLKQVVLWPSVRVGDRSELRGCVCARKVEVGAKSQIYESAVLGEKVRLGPMAMVAPRVKIWPEKIIPSGTILRSSLVWGNQEGGTLFSRKGIAGDFRGNLTPERLTQVGLCFASFLSPGKTVLVTKDHSPLAEMAQDALVLGLRAGGLHVHLGGEVAGQLTRFAVQYHGLDGAFHLGGLVENPSGVSVTYWNSRGRLLSKGDQRKIEGLFEREDYPRLGAEEFGTLTQAKEFTKPYIQLLARHYAPKVQPFQVGLLLDPCSTLGKLVQEFLELSGYSVVTDSFAGLPTIVTQPNAWFIQDEEGTPLSDLGWWQIYARALRAKGKGDFALPIHLSQRVARDVEEQGMKLHWTRMEPLFWMEVAGELGNNLKDQELEVFPQLEPLARIGELLHFLSGSERPLSSWQEETHLQEGQVPCPWDAKGRVMRGLLEHFTAGNTLFLDGIKEQGDGKWGLIVPDGDDPIFRLYSEAETTEEAEQIIRDYVDIIEAYQNEER